MNVNLTERELDRLDKLMESITRIHYLNFTIAGISLLVSSLEDSSAFLLPFGDIKLHYSNTAVGFYLLSLALMFCTFRLFSMAYPWLKMDPLRPSYAWFPLGTKNMSYWTVYFWIVLPFILSSLPMMSIVKGYSGIGLVLPGLFMIMVPESLNQLFQCIKRREDEKGNKMTFSIWLLYWYRLIRTIAMIVIFLAPILLTIPKWSDALKPILSFSTIYIVFMGVIRVFLGPVIYLRLDRLGVKWGFPLEYPYKK